MTDGTEWKCVRRTRRDAAGGAAVVDRVDGVLSGAAFIALALFIALLPSAAATAAETLACDVTIDEAVPLATAPHGARRLSPRHLWVGLRNGSARFDDSGGDGALERTVDGISLLTATFESPRWRGDDDLVVTVVCESGKGRGPTRSGHLIREGAAWRWHLDGGCPSDADGAPD